MADSPAWLQTLAARLWAHLPQEEPSFQHEGQTYDCRRTLTEAGQSVRFTEAWHDPVTFDLRQTWGLDLVAGVFVSPMTEPLWQQLLATLVAGITKTRPHVAVGHTAARFDPGRFAHRGALLREG